MSYSYLDGAPFATVLEMDMGSGIVDLAAVTVELGVGVVADELRSLGLPAVPDMASWGEGLGAVFHLGQPVDEREPIETRRRPGQLGPHDSIWTPGGAGFTANGDRRVYRA